MALTTPNDIKLIIDTDMEDDDISGYIDSASALIETWFSGVSASTTMLKEVERWLTAHLIAMSKERQVKEEGAGGAYVRYSGIFGTGLKTTSYGQTAIEIDSTNTLRSVSGKKLKFMAIKEGE
ncbi:MAG: hypothetical protein ACLFNL_08645 [Bacteroidales bacterium]